MTETPPLVYLPATNQILIWGLAAFTSSGFEALPTWEVERQVVRGLCRCPTLMQLPEVGYFVAVARSYTTNLAPYLLGLPVRDDIRPDGLPDAIDDAPATRASTPHATVGRSVGAGAGTGAGGTS